MKDRARPKSPRTLRDDEGVAAGVGGVGAGARRGDGASAAVGGNEGEGGPSSEVRPVEGGPVRSLYVATRLRGADAQSATITVTDASGCVLFEGGLGADGTVHMVLHGLGERAVVRVLLETVRVHRQAEVVVARPVTEHAFT